MSLADGEPRGEGARQVTVVVNFGSHALLDANLSAAPDALDRASSVLVVDNFHSEDERSAISELAAARGWSLVTLPTNAGFGAAVNAGVRAAAADGATDILLVNPDAVVPGAVARELHEQVSAEPMTLVSPRVLTSARTPYFHGIQLDLRTGRMRNRPRPAADAPARYRPVSDPGQRDWIGGACMAFSTRLWELAGGWDEDYFLYWEDVDFSQRCVDAGASLCIRNDLEVVHDEGGTHGEQRSRARSGLYYYYNCRNRLRYASLHLDRADRWRWLVATPRESWLILLRGGRRQLLESPRLGWAMVRGAASGVGLLLRHEGRGRR